MSYAFRPGRRFVRLFTLLALAMSSLAGVSPSIAGTESRWIVAFPSAQEDTLRTAGVEVWTRGGGVLIGGAGDAAVAAAAEAGLAPIVRVEDAGQWIYVLHHEATSAAPPAVEANVVALDATTALYLYPGGKKAALPYVKPRGAFMGVPRIALAPIVPHAADLARAPESVTVVNPLVTQIVNNTSQALWIQDVKDLSGENSVIVAGATRTITSRYSDAMFPTPRPNAYATEYLLEKAAGWGYTGARESYTNANSGCGQQTIPWQNVIITIPGQIDLGQHQQVLFVTHYDSLSYSTTESLNYAPGADDAISGGSALIEALRLFKDYAFRNTVKIIFFSGEEQGLCGSQAYVHQHPTADMWRAVNMDQTAYDGNLNSLMDCYNWSLASSPQSVALGDAYVQANTDYGPIVTPANIVRDTTHMCQTDHCPFWDAGVAAIALTEDLHNNDICPCFDQSQTATCHDTVTQVDPNHPPRLLFNPNYSWPTEKSAIALVASLADPLYVCPAAAPTLTVGTGNHEANLSWDAAAGVTNYVVERATSCAGSFTPIASATGTTYDDTGLTNGASYAYRLRTCANQTSACVTVVPNGPSAIYQPGSATVIADSGDHDLTADNCELVTVQLNVANDGNADLTGVKLSAVSSSHGGVQLATAIPQDIGDLAIGQSTATNFKFYLGWNGTQAACGVSIPFDVTTLSDQSVPIVRSFDLVAESDTVTGTLSYGFESDFSGWTVTTGSFTRGAGGPIGSAAFSLHSRSANSICDAVVSPVIIPTASSAMSMWVNFSIEGTSGAGSHFDRAVVRAINTTNGVKTLLVPTAVPYNTNGSTTGLCDNIGSLQGWSGDHLSWTQAGFNLASFAGIPIQLEVRFSTDTSVLGSQGAAKGFWFDQVQVTNATQVGACDQQSNVCAAAPAEVSSPGSPTPLTLGKNGGAEELTFSEVAGATSYNVYVGTIGSLVAGTYDHAPAGGLCGITDAVSGDGQVTTLATLAEDAYCLAVAVNGAGESTCGSSTAGTIPPPVTTCP